MFQFVDDLMHDRVRSLHFDFRIAALGLDPTAHNTESVAANEDRGLFKYVHVQNSSKAMHEKVSDKFVH